ncbi:MAG: MBL fold metallo-hydrolase [Thermoanaerobaculia bacterium]
MSTLSIAFLGSGSSGNCAVVRCGKTAVLLDAGLSLRETKRRLAARGVALEDVAAVFLTHEHADHVHGALALARKAGLPVYSTEGTAAAAGFPGPLFADVRTVRGGRDLVLGDLHVRVTSTPHDGVESVCYVFADAAGRRVGMVTDLGHLSRAVLDALLDCEVLGLEANHDEDLLRSGPYPPVLKRRILSDVGHLSNDAAAEGLKSLVGPRTRAVTALHVSRHNNTYPLAERVFREALAAIGASAALAVARHDVPTEWNTVS